MRHSVNLKKAARTPCLGVSWEDGCPRCGIGPYPLFLSVRTNSKDRFVQNVVPPLRLTHLSEENAAYAPSLVSCFKLRLSLSDRPYCLADRYLKG